MAILGVGGLALTTPTHFGLPEWGPDQTTKAILAGPSLTVLVLFVIALEQEEGIRLARDQTAKLGRLEATLRRPTGECLNVDESIPVEVERHLRGATPFVHAAVLAWAHRDDQPGRDAYRNLRDQKLRNTPNFYLWQIVVTHTDNDRQLEESLGLVARFEHSDHYELRSYEPGSVAMPAASMWSFHKDHVFLGSFGGNDEGILHVEVDRLNACLDGY